MGSLRARLARELGRAGPLRVLRKCLSLLFRRRAHMLFRLECAGVGFPPPRMGEQAHVITARNIGESASVVGQLLRLNAENADYLEDVERGRIIGLAFSCAGSVVHYSFLFKANKTARLLGLHASDALIGNAFTVAEWRGRGLQGRSVQARACIARDEGFQAVVAETSPDNLASQAGIQKGGMRPLGRMDLVVLFNCLVVRWRRPAGFALFDLCW